MDSPTTFNLKPQQFDFIGSCEQFPAYIGAVGTGKSASLIIKALFHSQESKGNLGVIVRKNFTDLRDSTMKDYERYTGRKINEQKKEDVLPNGSVIMFRHGDEIPTLQNMNLGWAAIEQAEEFPDDTTFQFLKMRLRRQSKFRTLFIVGNTRGHNWVWEIFKKDGPPKNHLLIEAKTPDFSDILPPDFLENLKTMPEKLYRRFVLNSWEEAEGLVYDEFIESEHVIESIEISRYWEKGLVLDHGFRNPTAVLFYAVDFDGNIIIYDEHYESEKPISYHAGKIKERGIDSGIADPSIFSKTQSRGDKIYSIADEYKDYGVSLIPAFKSVEQASIARVNEHFKAGKIKIVKNCQNTIKEVLNWKWKSVRPGANLNKAEEPEDRNNHACDGIKYLIASRVGKTELPQVTAPIHSPAWYLAQQKASEGHHYTPNRGYRVNR